VNQDKDPKSATSSKREVPDPDGSGLPPLPRPLSKEPAPLTNAAAASEPVAPEVEEVSGSLLIDDSWPDIGAPSAPAPPPRQVSKPPPPPLSRMTAGGTLRPAPSKGASSGLPAPNPVPEGAPVAPPPPSRPALPVPSLPPVPGAPSPMRSPGPQAAGADFPLGAGPPEARPPQTVARTSEDAATNVPLEAPTEPSLPIERESALRLPRAWGGVAAGALRDAVHKAGDSLRPTAHALRDAIPKIRDSLAPAANAVREVLPRVIPESLRSPAHAPAGSAPRWLLPAFGVGGLLLGIGIAVPTGMLLRRSAPDPADTATTPAASAAARAASSALAATKATPETAISPCRLVGAPRTLAAKATVSAGVEARAFGTDLALGYAASDTEGVVLRLDPTSLSILSTVTTTSTSPIRRVSPVVSPGGAIGLAVDADRKNDVLRNRRTISVDPPLQIGASASNLVWAQRVGGPVAGTLWPIEGRGEVDSIRSAASETDGESSLALVFRRRNVVGVGLARGGDSPAPKGSLTYFNGLGPNVGAPAIATNEGVILAAWADRAGPEAAWSLRVARFHAGVSSGEPHMFAAPPGGKGGSLISPSIAPLQHGGFLFVWSEGPPAERGVRAAPLSAAGGAIGPAIDVSSAGANAGQAQAALATSGHGVVAFLQSAGSGFELVATPIACGM
jgi:hypothetical protein